MWSYLTFKFLNPLLNTGYLSPLQEEDLYDLPKQNSPAHNFKILEKAWALEPPPDDQGEGGAFLWRVVMRMIWKPFTMCAILQLLSTLGRFASPMLLQQMVQLIETGETEDAWHGYVIAACMLTASIIQTAFDVHYNYQMNVLGLRVRGGMMGKVFQKAMRLSEPAFQRVGVGKIVNLVQIDCMKFSWALWCVHALWAMPIMLIVAIFMLCSMLGAAGFVGLIIMVVMMPVNMRIMQGQFKYQKRITERRDERVELLTELLQGMKLIKLLGWEQQMADKLDEKRQEELKAIKTKVFLEAGSTIMWQVSLNHTQPALWLCTGCRSFGTFLFTPSSVRLTDGCAPRAGHAGAGQRMYVLDLRAARERAHRDDCFHLARAVRGAPVSAHCIPADRPGCARAAGLDQAADALLRASGARGDSHP
jgi:ABC-type multidrug transport system fused ATPase/permease subunit